MKKELWKFERIGCHVRRTAYPHNVCKLGIGGLSSAEIMDRGNLIAAAPEMLEELRAILAWARIEKAPLRQLEIDSIAALIAKAKGEAK